MWRRMSWPSGTGSAFSRASSTRRARIDGRTLLKRTFDTDLRVCVRCGGRLTIRAVVTEPAAIASALISVGVEIHAAQLVFLLPVVVAVGCAGKGPQRDAEVALAVLDDPPRCALREVSIEDARAERVVRAGSLLVGRTAAA